MEPRWVVWARWLIVGCLFLIPFRAESASLTVDTPVGLAGETIEVAVRLAAEGADVSAALAELSFDPAVPIAPAESGHPDCTAALGAKALSGFTYRPSSCTFGVDCEAVLGAVLSVSGPLPDGILFRCRVDIPALTPTDTTYLLEVIEGIVSDPSGIEVDVTEESHDGTVVVVDDPLCVGDCNDDQLVTVAELVTGIDRAFTRERAACPFSDRDADGTVGLSELIAAVGNSISACPTRRTRAPGREVVALPSAASSGDH